MTPEFGVNPTGFSLQNSFLGWCFGWCQRWCLALVVWKVGFVVDFGMAFVDNRVVGKEKGCYWLSNDIVGLVGNLVV